MLLQAALVIYFLLATVSCEDRGCGAESLAVLNVFGQVVLILVTGYTAFVLLRHEANTAWTPAVIYAVSTAVFFGFGPMSNFLSSASTIAHLQLRAYPVSAESLLQANLLTMVGVFSCVVGMWVTLSLAIGNSRRVNNAIAPLPLGLVGLLFLSGGLGLKYGLLIPAKFGNTDGTIPGALNNLGYLADLGFAIAAFEAARGRRIWMIIFWLIWPLHLSITFLEFAKKSVVFAMLLPAIGSYLAHRKEWRAALWIAALIILFVALQPINTVARNTLAAATGDFNKGTFSQRLAILKSSLGADVDLEQLLPTNLIGVDVWWLRLNYAGPQIKAMEMYDAGWTGEQQYAYWAFFIPRVIWPDKPLIIPPGREFHARVTGNYENETLVGATVYGDGYLQYGWLGVISFSLIMGAVFGQITFLSYRQIVRRDLLYLPAVFLGIRMAGLGPTGFLATSIIAGLPLYIGYLSITGVILYLRRSNSTARYVPLGGQVNNRRA